MGARIREFDWASHPFGPAAGWPQSLRSALTICLNSAFPTAIYWGSELRLLYNDAWAPIPGPRHPESLGAPAREVWADIWHVIEPQFRSVIATGEGLFLQEQFLPMRRYGAEETLYFNYSFTPLRTEDGAIGGIFNSGSEVTENVLGRSHAQMLLEIGDAFRNRTEVGSALQDALAHVGRTLDVDRVGLRLRDGAGDLPITTEWQAEGVDPVAAGVTLDTLGEEIAGPLRAGRAARLDGVKDRADARQNPVLRQLGVAASLSVPWISGGDLTAALFVHSRRPRHWTERDTTTLRAVLEKIMVLREREAALARERTMAHEIDHRARNLMGVIQSIVRMAQAEDVPALKDKLMARIGALSRTHSLLTAGRWDAIALSDLLSQELAPYSGDAAAPPVRLDGPDVPLDADRVQSVGLVAHELATNAAKYGALSAPGGALDVTWRLEGDELVLVWAETLPGSGPVPSDVTPTGFGSLLLRRVVEEQLSGSLRRTGEPGRLTYTIRAPVTGSPDPAVSPTGLEAGPADETGQRTVLIVEDEAVVALDLADTVRELGFAVFGTASSLEAGQRLVATELPDIALLDVDLSGQSSLPLAERLRDQGVTILLATGYDIENDPGHPGAEYPRITKPVSPQDLARRLGDPARRVGG